MLVACWFAVLKAGGVAVSTMPLLRVRELTEVCERADIRLALTDTTDRGRPRDGSEIAADARVVHFNTQAPESLDALMAGRLGRPSTTC